MKGIAGLAIWIATLGSTGTGFCGVWQLETVPASAQRDRGQPLYYRCFLRVPDNMTSRAAVDLWTDSTMISFADFPGPFTVVLNGQKIAQGDQLPEEPRRRFKVPKGILEKKRFNVLAIRLEGEAAKTGLRVVPVLHGYHDELVLEGTWETHVGEPDAADLRAVTNHPARAFFTEAGFREASTALAANAELVHGERLPPAESLAKMRTPAELAVDLLLHEPQVAQPTHLSFDARGRLWVAQYRQYPYPAGLKMVSRDKYYRSTFDRVAPAPPYHDRGADIISVHEDTDGDGRFDRHRNVLTGLNMANAALHGRGGIWVMHTPYLLFYPDADGDDVPDRDPEIRLAGFGLEDTHSIANGLAWGPDGWIYGAQGSTTTSHIRRPGIDSPDSPGVYYESCMAWRYHPERREYEIFAEGGGNNFGLEFDAGGRLYTGYNGAETRGWHFVQGGIYLKQGKDPGKFGPPSNPFAFGELPMMGTTNKVVRFSHHFAVAEGTALPADYVGRLFCADPLHRNIVVSARTLAGSTFTTADSGYALESDDIAFRPVFVANGPDGGIYVADFYEQYIAHGQNYQGQIDPTSGRVYRLRGKDAQLRKDVNLAKKSTSELLDCLSDANRWHRQTAVRLLGERRDPSAKPTLLKLLGTTNSHPALEGLWSLHQAGWLNEPTALAALRHPAALVRTWAIRLLGDTKQLPDQFMAAVLLLVASEPDAEVRCQIASTARRLPANQALPLVAALLRRDVDSRDAFIPLLCWWTIEQLCDTERTAILDLPLWESATAREHILPRLVRRFATKGTRADLLVCAQLLRSAPANRKALLASFEEAFRGRAIPTLPSELVEALAESGQTSLLLRVRRGESEEALELIANHNAKRDDRLMAIRAFGDVSEPRAVPKLIALARDDRDPELRKAALASLSRYPNPEIGTEIASVFPKLPPSVQDAAQNLLTSRAEWAASFLKLVETGVVKPSRVPSDVLARLRKYDDKKVAELFPALRPERRDALTKIQTLLRTEPGSPYRGEPIFAERCASCHQLFHKGGQIGPNLTTYQRDDLSTMLPSILDPNAEIREGYATYLVETKDGRALSGFVTDQDAHIVVLRSFDGSDIPLSRNDIVEMKRAEMSLMPEGLLEGLTDQQLRDFFAYLRIPQPISR